MDVSDFTVGKTYVVTTKSWVAPDESCVVPGKTMTVTILPHQGLGEALSFDGFEVVRASAMEVGARKGFLRVVRENGRVHLLHPETIATKLHVN